MALKYYSGFESDATILAADGIVFTGSCVVTTAERHQTSSGRGGSKSLQLDGASTTVRIPAFTAGAAEQVGIAVRFSSGSILSIRFDKISRTNCSVRIEADGFMRLYRGDATALLATSARILNPLAWHWLLIEVTAREAGRIRVFLNGSRTAFVDTGAGVDCRDESTDDFDSVLIDCDANPTVNIDDYVQGGAGTLPNRALYGQMIRPVSDASPIEATPSTGTDNWANLDDDPVSLEDHNEFTVAGQEDRFNMGNLGFTPPNVLAVRTMAHMTGEGAITQGRGLVESGGSTTYGTNRALATGGTYQIVGDIFTLDPHGDIPWTGAAVNALISGMEANT